jgi:hypothetical protein
MHKLPVITLMPPDHCAKCGTKWDGDVGKFTLIGKPEHLIWLCNPCFIKLYRESPTEVEKEKLTDVKVGDKATQQEI